MCFRQAIIAGLIAACFANGAFGQALQCQGSAPDWQLEKSAEAASFTFLGKTTAFEIPQFSEAEGEVGATAYSLIADFDTAILLVDERQCGADAPLTAYVLTQKGMEAILLRGCCRPVAE